MDTTRIAVCGIDCSVCPAFHASERLSMEERQAVADRWGKEHNASFKATDIDCVGCTARKGVQVGYCSQCQIRLCGLEKKYASCADCPQFACERLEGFLKSVPQARDNLVRLRA